MFSKRINIFIGHFGSGKTETAINYAMNLNEQGYKTAIVDLDIVNPFFRTSDVEEELSRRNIKLVKPVYANTNIDVPALPGDVNMIFQDKSYKVILDVGGDDLGAKAVSRYKDFIEKEDYELFFVVNTKRPFTSNIEKIKAMLLEIQESTRLKVTALVNNTNLLAYTKPSDILESNEVLNEISEELSIDYKFLCATEDVAQEIKKLCDKEILLIDGFIKLPWNK